MTFRTRFPPPAIVQCPRFVVRQFTCSQYAELPRTQSCPVNWNRIGDEGHPCQAPFPVKVAYSVPDTFILPLLRQHQAQTALDPSGFAVKHSLETCAPFGV